MNEISTNTSQEPIQDYTSINMNGININKKMIVFTTTIVIPIGNVNILYDSPIPT